MAEEVSGLVEAIGNMFAFEQEALFAVEDAVTQVAKEALAYAQVLTPVSQDGSHGNPAGYLQSRNQVGETTTTLTETSAELSNDADYALYVELGTVKMAAQPFLTPALEYGGRRLAEIMRELAAG